MASISIGWLETAALTRLRSIVSSIFSSPLEPAPEGQSSNFQTLRSRSFLFLGLGGLLVSVVLLVVCVSLYPLGIEYQVMNSMYESRWLVTTIFFSSVTSICLCIWKRKTFYILCCVACVYNCASCLVLVIIYGLDFRKSLYLLHPPISSRMAAAPRSKYLRLCGCMVAIGSVAFFLGVLILCKLRRLAQIHYPPVSLHKSQKRYLLYSSLSQIPFIWFSIYVACHVISMQFSNVQQYMIQELLCAFTIQTITIFQISTIYCTRTNRITLILLMTLNICQFIQEIFYTWNSYYLSLYIHSSRAKLATGAKWDRYILGINFLGHFVRTCLTAYTSYRLSVYVDCPLNSAVFRRADTSHTVRRTLTVLSLCALSFATAHLIMDIFYTLSAHIYRTLIAFTGISVFYLTIIAVTLGLFLKTNRTIFLSAGLVSTLLLTAVSIHGLYTYLDISFNNVLLAHLETLGKDRTQPSYMHFTEACLSLFSFILCLITGILIFRLLNIENRHNRHLERPIRALAYVGLVQATFTLMNSILLICIKDDHRVFQSMLAYGVLDTLSSFILSITQIYITRSVNRATFTLTALLLLLICECLTTYNYLSTKTAYIQLLIIFNRMFSGNALLARNRLANLFPTKEVSLLISSHVVQLIQWFLNLASLTLTALSLEFRLEEGVSLNVVDTNSADAGTAAVDEHKSMESGKEKVSTEENSYSNQAYEIEMIVENPVGPLDAMIEGGKEGVGSTDHAPLIQQDMVNINAERARVT